MWTIRLERAVPAKRTARGSARAARSHRPAAIVPPLPVLPQLPATAELHRLAWQAASIHPYSHGLSAVLTPQERPGLTTGEIPTALHFYHPFKRIASFCFGARKQEYMIPKFW